MTASNDELAKTLTDLLTIAKVAMPEELFALDPRVLRAQELLTQLQNPTSSRHTIGLPNVSAVGRKPPYKGE